MNLTARLKSWLSENCGVAAAASDEDYTKAALTALGDGKLAPAKYAELTAPEQKDDIKSVLAKLVKDAVADLGLARTEPVVEPKEVDLDALADKLAAKMAPQKGLLDGGVSPDEVFAPIDSPTAKLINGSRERIRVKSPIEGYSTSKSALVHHKGVMAGQQAKFMNRPLDTASQADLAVAGAYYKWCVTNSMGDKNVPRNLRCTDHDKQLVEYALHEMSWTGAVKGQVGGEGIEIPGRKLSSFEIKALLDDSQSGGLEAAPIVFDDRVITTPLLTGELFPLVDVTPLSRGRRVEGWSISNPSFTSNIAEGTEIPVFDTTSMIAAFDNTIYTAVAAIEIGYDFEDDTPNNIGAIVTDLYGRAALEYLDEQIAWGDGTNEPQGIFNAGLTDIGNPAGGAGADPQVDDYEALLFGIAKQYRPRSDSDRCVFVGTDVSYKRARGIQVGASDERRVFGMDEESYQVLGHGFKVPQCRTITAATANANAAFVNLRYYRLYRRLGLTMRVETAGKELALKNQMLMVMRMRWGGKMTLTAAGAFSDNWKA